MSTLTCLSYNRCKFSAEPSDGRILSSTLFLSQRIFRYFSAFARDVLPSGPLVMTIVLGGAMWKNQKMAKTKMAATPTAVEIAPQRLMPKMSENGFQTRVKIDFCSVSLATF